LQQRLLKVKQLQTMCRIMLVNITFHGQWESDLQMQVLLSRQALSEQALQNISSYPGHAQRHGSID
jgi:hypothetical protein